jgi:DNA uptake protein ComE-like DNA-binding protein
LYLKKWATKGHYTILPESVISFNIQQQTIVLLNGGKTNDFIPFGTHWWVASSFNGPWEKWLGECPPKLLILNADVPFYLKRKLLDLAEKLNIEVYDIGVSGAFDLLKNKSMKNKFSTFFHFPTSLRNGFLALFFLVWCLLSRQLWALSFLETNEKIPVYAVFKAEKQPVKQIKIPKDFRLNINEADLQSLDILSVPDFLGRRWVKYLENGGSFKGVGDVKKLYGMSEPLYNSISKYLYVKEAVEKQRKPFYKENRVYRCKTIDINEADSAQWEALYGIGPYLAKRIITFRESLCGFVSVDQVKETYGLRDSVFQSIKTCLTIENNLKPCISINYTNQEGLSKHPYVRYKLARAICLYRENNGLFQRIEDLKKLPIVSDSIYNKLFPYITLNSL